MTINSKNSKYMKTVETSIEFQNFTPEEIEHIFDDLKISSLFLVDNSDEETNKVDDKKLKK